MKKAIVIIILLVSLPANAELITGIAAYGGYEWEYGYNIDYYSDAIQVSMGIHAMGYDSDLDLLKRFEYGIESRWTTDRFEVPIIFDVNWVDTDWTHQVYIRDAYGRSKIFTWYSDGYWSREYTAAHEFGHLLGLPDEYAGGATGLYVGTGGLMATDGPTLDYYYDGFLSWYDSGSWRNSQEITIAQTPEPTSLVLLSAGLFSVARFLKRKKEAT